MLLAVEAGGPRGLHVALALDLLREHLLDDVHVVDQTQFLRTLQPYECIVSE